MSSEAKDLLPWFQIASTLIAGIGIAASTTLGIAALKDNRRERRHNILPNLLFTPRGEVAEVSLSPERVFPGKDADDPDLITLVGLLPEGTRSLRLKNRLGELKNYGSGPAFGILLSFKPTGMLSGGEWRSPTFEEQRIYGFEGANDMTPSPAHLPPEGVASIGTLPAAVCFLYPNSTATKGQMTISCRDAQGVSIERRQHAIFELAVTDDSETTGELTVSFGAVLEAPSYGSLFESSRAS